MNKNKEILKELKQAAMQISYIRRAFSVAIDALEKISDIQESRLDGPGKEFEIAQKSLRRIKALNREACTEEDML